MKRFKILAMSVCLLVAAAGFAACGETEPPDPPGVTTYVYEAEDIYVSELSGPVFSGEASGYKMILGENITYIKNNSNLMKSISGGYFLSYFNGVGTTLQFIFEADAASEGNTLLLRLASEWGTLKINPANIEIRVNGEAVTYSELTVSGEKLSDDGSHSAYKTPFKDFEISKDVKITAGENIVELEVLTREYGISTIEKYGPGVDCIKIKTTSALTWEKLFEENKDQIEQK
ncbi:MAG: hypothetical protein LBS99_03065 [Clostridiales bacterium]|jgi:hypothetical protein|nr:hypothetical protein [Clostridiales bacterium]